MTSDPLASKAAAVDAVHDRACTIFVGLRRVASGPLRDVVLVAKAAMQPDETGAVAIFDDESGRPIDIDMRGTPEEVRGRFAPPPSEGVPQRGPGRPKLGVVAREVTLLPRHWDWLGAQPGGASVALRRLVEAARRDMADGERVRAAQSAAHAFMTAMAGDRPGYEEAARALWSRDRARFENESKAWPEDIRDHARRLAGPVFERASGNE